MQDNNHQLLLYVRMHLIPEINTVLNTQGRKKVKKLHACQWMWPSSKLMTICKCKIEHLDSINEKLGLSLRDVMMRIWHPAIILLNCLTLER